MCEICFRYLYKDDLVYAFATVWTGGLFAYLAVLHGFSGQHRQPFWHKCKWGFSVLCLSPFHSF